jgi:hypothetical protein
MFCQAARSLEYKLGVRVTVVSAISTQPPMIAQELRRQAEEFIDIKALQFMYCRANSNTHNVMMTMAISWRLAAMISHAKGATSIHPLGRAVLDQCQ